MSHNTPPLYDVIRIDSDQGQTVVAGPLDLDAANAYAISAKMLRRSLPGSTFQVQPTSAVRCDCCEKITPLQAAGDICSNCKQGVMRGIA